MSVSWADKARRPATAVEVAFRRGAVALLWLSALAASAEMLLAAGDATARIEFAVNDADAMPLACRIHLHSEQGEPQQPPGHPFWRDHFVSSGRVVVAVKPGHYRYAIERGPEYERRSGAVEVAANSSQAVGVALRRIANLRGGGWFSADLHVHRPLEDIERLMLAEDLDFCPVITWWNDRSTWKRAEIPRELTRRFDGHRLYDAMAGEDEREGGALLYFGLDRPLDLAGSAREVPSPMQFVEQARSRNPQVWIDIEKPFWWDVPAWLASGRMNSIGLANNHMCRSQMLANEAWGKPRDAQRLPDPRGNGIWTQEIYYHVLNSGLRIPPSAGSASGVLPNPVGYNRVYAHLDGPLERDAWFASLALGRCFVTNGPLLLVTANDQLPGATFETEQGHPLQVTLKIQLASNDRVPRLELIHNGRVAKSVDCSDATTQQQSISLAVDGPGWFLVRAIADVSETFRFASTGPWFVESGAAKTYISRRSAQFFLDWVDERIERVKSSVADEDARRDVLAWHERARAYWARRVEMAGAE